jgi:hypothetical protein
MNEVFDVLIYTSTFLTAVGIILAFIKKSASGIKRMFYQKEIVPKKTLTIIPKPSLLETSFFWHLGKQGNKSGIQIHGNFIVSNLTHFPIKFGGVQLRTLGYKGIVLTEEILPYRSALNK